eukprot:4193938-Amphidinium_carterae.1
MPSELCAERSSLPFSNEQRTPEKRSDRLTWPWGAHLVRLYMYWSSVSHRHNPKPLALHNFREEQKH